MLIRAMRVLAIGHDRIEVHAMVIIVVIRCGVRRRNRTTFVAQGRYGVQGVDRLLMELCTGGGFRSFRPSLVWGKVGGESNQAT